MPAAGRSILQILVAVLLMSLAACQIVPGGDGASASAASRLAAIRSAHGLGALRPDPGLERAARRQAAYMAASGRMVHDTGYGRDFASRMSNTRTNGAAAENIARGAMSLDRLFDMWMNSAGHRTNILDPRFTRFGLASSGEGRDRYWSLVLSR